MDFDLIWPTITLAALIFIVATVLAVARARHLRRVPPTRDQFATGAKARAYFEPVEMPANNLVNLFEMPVLYFALVPLLILTGYGTPIQVGLAWAYVMLRGVHSFIHIVVKDVPRRALVFAASTGVLMAMWIGFAVDLLLAAN